MLSDKDHIWATSRHAREGRHPIFCFFIGAKPWRNVFGFISSRTSLMEHFTSALRMICHAEFTNISIVFVRDLQKNTDLSCSSMRKNIRQPLKPFSAKTASRNGIANGKSIISSILTIGNGKILVSKLIKPNGMPAFAGMTMLPKFGGVF